MKGGLKAGRGRSADLLRLYACTSQIHTGSQFTPARPLDSLKKSLSAGMQNHCSLKRLFPSLSSMIGAQLENYQRTYARPESPLQLPGNCPIVLLIPAHRPLESVHVMETEHMRSQFEKAPTAHPPPVPSMAPLTSQS